MVRRLFLSSRRSNMKKAFVLCVIISMMCSMIAFADETESFFPTYEQTASAYLDQSGKAVKVTVDLTGGWSVEFAPGAVYLYEGNTDGEAAALRITLDEEVYAESAEPQKTAQLRAFSALPLCHQCHALNVSRVLLGSQHKHHSPQMSTTLRILFRRVVFSVCILRSPASPSHHPY